MALGDNVKITEIKCPGCGSTLKVPAGNVKLIQCEYCGNEYSVDLGQSQANAVPRRVPDWEPIRLEPEPRSSGSVWAWIALIVFGIAGIFVFVQNQKPQEDKTVIPKPAEVNSITYGGAEEKEEAFLSGMLGQMAAVAFGKDIDNVTEQDLAQIQWIADRSDIDYSYIGYSFENPLENPDAELEWLTFPYGSDRGYYDLGKFSGLKKLDTTEYFSRLDLQGMQLESLTARLNSPNEAADVLGDTASSIRQLTISNEADNLEGLERFTNLEMFSLDAGKLTDVSACVALAHLKSLTLKDADNISDFFVLASIENLEELSIESENLKSMEFVKRMPQLKSLGISDGKLLDLNGIEVLEGLEKLSVKDCRDLTDMSSINALTGLKELTLELPYDCTEPSLEALTELQSLTLKNFHSCAFLPRMTHLESLTLQSCDLSEKLDLSGLSQLKKLTFTTSYQDRSLSFVSKLSSLEEANLSGMITYDDISGIFALPNIKRLNLSGIECEIDFNKVSDNPSLESLDMAGVKLYENVKISGGYGIVNIDWDDVYLVDHLDFFAHFPNLKKLNVADNKIKDLDFVESLVKMEEIDFSDNYVSDMHVLASFPALRQVNCKGNPISNLRVLDDAHVNIINE